MRHFTSLKLCLNITEDNMDPDSVYYTNIKQCVATLWDIVVASYVQLLFQLLLNGHSFI